MFIKNYQLAFLTLLISGTLIASSANSWFTAWIGLEINLMSMIPLMLIKLNPNLTEASIKYFLAQAMASVILIFAISMNFLFQENIMLEISEFFIISSLILKAGVAPCHFWFPQVIKLLNWIQCLILFTWQKVAPLILISTLNSKLIIIICVVTVIMGAIGGLNQIFMKMILTYSSISHSGWMIMANFINLKIWITYFLIYCSISLAIILYFQKNKTNKLQEVFNSPDNTPNKLCLAMNLLSLGGMPPLLGFSAKLSVILMIISSNFKMIIIPMIISSLISLFFYIRVLYSNFTLYNSKPLFNFSEKKYNNLFVIISICLNAVTPIMFLA